MGKETIYCLWQGHLNPFETVDIGEMSEIRLDGISFSDTSLHADTHGN